MDSLHPTEQLASDVLATPQPIPQPSTFDGRVKQKTKRLLSEKQREALKIGREKRWKKMFEALEKQQKDNEENIPPPPHQSTFLDQEPSPSSTSSSDAESSETEFPVNVSKRSFQNKKKSKLPRSIRKRVDKYIQEKLDESLLLDKPVPPPQHPSYNSPYLSRPECHRPLLQYL